MKYVAGVDIETTGLAQAEGHRIIEIAILIYELATERYVGKYVTRINPLRPIDPKAQAVHGISFEELSSCKTWEEIAPDVSKVFSKVDGALVAHNGVGFDMPFINAELARVGLPKVILPVVDTMLQARWATPNGKSPNLGELCFACGIDYNSDEAHAAEYDVKVMLASFFEGYRTGFFKIESETLIES